MLWKLTLLQFEFWIQLQSFKWKIKNKIDLQKRSLNEQEWHLALEMLASETTHAGRERENTSAKQQQVKAWETKSLARLTHQRGHK
jgi:hypothetical protein